MFSRSPHGERGLKSIVHHLGGVKDKGRSPHGERGLKFDAQSKLRLASVALLTESVD